MGDVRAELARVAELVGDAAARAGRAARPGRDPARPRWRRSAPGWPTPPSRCARRWPTPRRGASGASAWPTTCCGRPAWSRASATASSRPPPRAPSPTSRSCCRAGGCCTWTSSSPSTTTCATSRRATDRERDQHAIAFVRDVRARVRELSGRVYIDPDDTLDEVLLFIPNEAVYAFVHQHDRDLVEVALAPEGGAVLAVHAVLGAGGHPPGRRADPAPAHVRRDPASAWPRSRRSGASSPTRSTRWAAASTRVRRSWDDLSGTRRRQLERQLDRVRRAPHPARGGRGWPGRAGRAHGRRVGRRARSRRRRGPPPGGGRRPPLAPAPRVRRRLTTAGRGLCTDLVGGQPRRCTEPLGSAAQSVAITLAMASRNPSVPSRACWYCSSVRPPPCSAELHQGLVACVGQHVGQDVVGVLDRALVGDLHGEAAGRVDLDEAPGPGDLGALVGHRGPVVAALTEVPGCDDEVDVGAEPPGEEVGLRDGVAAPWPVGRRTCGSG